jgi:membrane protein DedA with SNARE-associated domain
MNDDDTRTPPSSCTHSDERVIGLIAEPGLSEDVARAVASELPGILARCTDGNGSSGAPWRVEVVRRLLPLNAMGNLRLLDVARDHRHDSWAAAIVLTELPRRVGTRPILADCAPEHGVGLISLTALGVFGIRRKTRKLLVHLITTYFAPEMELATGRVQDRSRQGGALPRRYRMIDEREWCEDGAQDVDKLVKTNVELDRAGLHYALPGIRGQAQLLAGMVRANRPWRLVPSLSPALASALAGAAFGVFYSSIWQLSDASSIARLALVTVLSIASMIAWLVLSNGLWERSADARTRRFSAIYNAATLLTVSSGVAIMFMLLFTATFLGACVIIPASYLTHTLHHPAGLSDFATLAWLAACLGTLAGALGSGLADEATVRNAAYSRRERERQDRRAAAETRAEQGAQG